jgi:hypothetical protein
MVDPPDRACRITMRDISIDFHVSVRPALARILHLLQQEEMSLRLSGESPALL